MKPLLHTLTLIFILSPLLVLAQESSNFTPLVGIPFMNMSTSPNLSDYVNNLYRATITVAALLAVVRIILAGFQYMFTDIVTQKTDARKGIKNALLGLLIVIGAVLILETINPTLVQVNTLRDLKGFVMDLGHLPVAVRTDTPETPTETDSKMQACKDRESEGYKFRVYGPADDRRSECCIPNETCSATTQVQTDTGITIDTATPYTPDDYNALVRELATNGSLIFHETPALSTNTEREEQVCKNRSGTPYTVNVERAASTQPIQQRLLCVK